MIKNNGDSELKKECSEWSKNDRFYIGPHEVDVKFRGVDAIVSWHYGGLVPSGHDKIKVKCNPYDFIGLKKIKPFEERIQNAVDKMQRRCDEYDRIELMERELNKKYHT